jgi:flagellar protein FliO/FliZ
VGNSSINHTPPQTAGYGCSFKKSRSDFNTFLTAPKDGRKSSARIKKLAALYALICVLFFGGRRFCYAQDAPPQNPEELIELESAPVGSSANSLNSNATQSSIFLFVRMIIVLALVALCIFFVMRFFKRGSQGAPLSDPYLKKTASLTLSPGKSVHVITLDDNAFIIGVTDAAVNLIGKIENKELVDAMNLHAEEQSASRLPRDFSRLLGLFGGPRQKASETKQFTKAFDETARVIRGQRSRLSTLKTQDGDEAE